MTFNDTLLDLDPMLSDTDGNGGGDDLVIPEGDELEPTDAPLPDDIAPGVVPASDEDEDDEPEVLDDDTE